MTYFQIASNMRNHYLTENRWRLENENGGDALIQHHASEKTVWNTGKDPNLNEDINVFFCRNMLRKSEINLKDGDGGGGGIKWGIFNSASRLFFIQLNGCSRFFSHLLPCFHFVRNIITFSNNSTSIQATGNKSLTLM